MSIVSARTRLQSILHFTDALILDPECPIGVHTIRHELSQLLAELAAAEMAQADEELVNLDDLRNLPF